MATIRQKQMQTVKELQYKFFKCWAAALADPMQTRVIIETDEKGRDWQEDSPYNVTRYYMIDATVAQGGMATRIDNYLFGEWQVACSDGHAVSTRNYFHVARFAERMIKSGRATDIYNDCY